MGIFNDEDETGEVRVLTPREMAEVDRAAIEEVGIPSLTLMERAGLQVAEKARDMLSEARGSRVAVWCGKGNNGGDGLVAARLLAGWGYEAEVLLLADPQSLSKDSRANLERLEGVNLTLVSTVEAVEGLRQAVGFDLVIDAIFGTGFSGRVDGLFRLAIQSINESGSRVLSVDIPSGVCGETGAVDGPAVVADCTVTFVAPKIGLVQFPGAACVGEMEIVDIGIPEHLLDNLPSSKIYLANEPVAHRLLPRRKTDTHKWRCGSVAVVGGSPGMSGATTLCARAALRCGAGMVVLAVPSGIATIVEIKVTEAITVGVSETGEGTIGAGALEQVMGLSRSYDVMALGVGMSREEETVELVRKLVSTVDVPMVLDADGLNALVGHTGLMADREAPLVVTPHPGEMARLLEIESHEVQRDRVATARRAAERWGSVVVLKGAGTVVSDAAGRVTINTTGNAGMATAGMGDVLTGCIAALLAQGLPSFEAAVAGVYFHGYAADLVSNMDGMVGMLAGDVVRYLPLSMRRNEQ